MYWPLWPVWANDIIGSIAMIVISLMCLGLARRIFAADPEEILANYLLWFIIAMFAFSASRSVAHLLRHVFYFTGSMPWWNTLSPITGSINTVALVFIASVTLFFHRVQGIMDRMARDRQKIERTSQELLDLNRSIEEIVAERTQAEMALRIAHEVRNPATIIGGLIQRLAKTTPKDSEDAERLAKILIQARKLETLVTRFAGLNPAMKKFFRPQDLNELVAEAIDIAQPEAEDKGVILLYDRFPSPLIFLGDRHLIKIGILHILRNAIEASTQGDTVDILSGLGEGGIFVRIQDQGPGIPPDILKHVYEPFHPDRGRATGLGIPYVKQIVEEHKGRIAFRSSAEQGTLVEIWLPTHLGTISGKDSAKTATAAGSSANP